jgi:peptidoglycan hydrolase-like amidase
MLALTIAATVHISVMGSPHPVQFALQAAKGAVLIVETEGRTETVQGARTMTITGPIRMAGRGGTMARFHLSVPGIKPREYVGKLQVRRVGAELLAIVEMDRETAVAAITDAEGSPGMPFEARKAQAVVTRSYLAGARNRHVGFDFCDTDHCQLLKSVAPEDSAASAATVITHAQVVTYKGDVVPTLYSASCGGHTKTLAQSKWMGANIPQPGYPYFSVACPLQGRAAGHGVGMCQLGSMEIARHGHSARIILGHYFPNTVIETVEFAPPRKIERPHAPTLTSAPKTAPPPRILAASVGMGVHAAP